MKKRLFFTGLILSAVLGISLLFAGCYTPSPLYGTWADNNGNKITFLSDGSFNADVVNTENKATSYSGSWSIIDNVLIFNITGDSSYSRDTEWDIRGAILYLYWTSNNNTNIISLYHTAR